MNAVEKLIEFVPFVKEAFGVEELGELGDDEMFSAVFELPTLARVIDQTRLLRDILVALAKASLPGGMNFSVTLACLQEEMFALGLEFELRPRDLYGGEKIAGRSIHNLVGSLTSAQRETLAAWQALAIREVTEGSPENQFREDQVDLMRNVLEWFSLKSKQG
jgi:hypothetical protein